MNKLIFLCATLLFSYKVNAQNRVEKPVQIHLNGSGVFLKVFGNKLADSEVDDLKVQKWGVPGISLGYHLNSKLYVGYAFQPNRNLVLKELWTFGENGKDGNITVDHNTGSSHSLVGRYFPFKFDLYGTLFFTHITKAKYEMQFNRTGSQMTIGQNAYPTDILANWNFKSLSTIGVGLGYNYVHKSGFSIDIGIGIPIPFSEPLHENILIKSQQNISILPTDLESAKKKIENEQFYFPVQFQFNLGYNFLCERKKNKK